MVRTVRPLKKSSNRTKHALLRAGRKHNLRARANPEIDWTVDVASASSTISSAPIPRDIAIQMQEASKNAEHKESPFLRLLFGSSPRKSH